MAAAAGYIYFALIMLLMTDHHLTHDEAVTSFTLQGVAALIGRFIGTAWMSTAQHHTAAVYAGTLAVGMMSQVCTVNLCSVMHRLCPYCAMTYGRTASST